ncbi:hypothetical protein GCM10007392_26320 [Saccharospirillum salsuginis]|uniref:Uncharacterized protein n=1 Tax=Saccharospirillum salsuginis TaxID=418750 RepID=A0A918NC40_9GAMM|nr:hypothetical protein GCM10007392_26320 [Saccharospirillum salsuginis]
MIERDEAIRQYKRRVGQFGVMRNGHTQLASQFIAKVPDNAADKVKREFVIE